MGKYGNKELTQQEKTKLETLRLNLLHKKQSLTQHKLKQTAAHMPVNHVSTFFVVPGIINQVQWLSLTSWILYVYNMFISTQPFHSVSSNTFSTW